MSRLRVAPIVEGHGEESAVPLLLRRIWTEIVGGTHIRVLHPLRRPRSRLIQEGELHRAVDFAVRKLQADPEPQARDLVLLLLDGNGAPGVRARAPAARRHEGRPFRCGCRLRPREPRVRDLVRRRRGLAPQRILRAGDSPTVDQPSLTGRMDLSLCRSRAPSFDKLCRELEKRRDPAGD